MLIKTDLIDSNPYRDFKNYAIEEDSVKALIDSYQRSGDFGTLPAREVNGRYQIAAGHHRLAAMTKMGFKTVDLKATYLTDSQMVRIMVSENATQRGGDVKATLDSISAITELLAYEYLRYASYEEFKEASPEKDIKKKAWESSRGRLLSGEGLGRPTITRFLGENILSEKAVKIATKTLKATGKLIEIIAKVEVEIEEESEAALQKAEEIKKAAALKAKERAKKLKEEEELRERKIKEAETRALKEAEEAEERALKRAKDAKERKIANAKRIKANQEAKAKKDAERKKAAEKKRLSDEKSKSLKKEADRKEKAARDKAHVLDMRKKEAKVARENQKKALVSWEAVKLFSKSPAHVKVFIDMVSKDAESNNPVFAKDKHIELAEHVIAWCIQPHEDVKPDKSRLTASRIQDGLERCIKEGRMIKMKIKTKVDREIYENSSLEKKFFNARDAFKKAYSQLSKFSRPYYEMLLNNPELEPHVTMGLERFFLEKLIKDLIKTHASMNHGTNKESDSSPAKKETLSLFNDWIEQNQEEV